MNIDFQVIEEKTNPYAKNILVSAFVVFLFLYIVYFTPWLKFLQIPTAFLLPFLLIYSIILSIFVYKTIHTPLPVLPFLAGLFFIAGGAAFDGIATVIMTPTLTLEGNPVARSLLDSGFSSIFVIFYGTISQILFVTFICILWASFLKHKEVFIPFVKNNENSFLNFLKAVMGGKHLTWRQFFLPLAINELPTSYYALWILTICFAGGSLYRWYLGLNWFGLVSFPMLLTILVSVILPYVGYLIWLRKEFITTKK